MSGTATNGVAGTGWALEEYIHPANKPVNIAAVTIRPAPLCRPNLTQSSLHRRPSFGNERRTKLPTSAGNQTHLFAIATAGALAYLGPGKPMHMTMMKRYLILLAAAMMLAVNLNLQAADKPDKGLLRHVVIFKYKDTAKPEEIAKVEAAFRALKKSIPGIVSFESGVNVSPENLNKGFTHCYILTFKTEKARDNYLTHPEHQKFVDLIKPVLAEPLVIDFWVQE